MNASDKLARLRALLERVQSNARGRPGVRGDDARAEPADEAALGAPATEASAEPAAEPSDDRWDAPGAAVPPQEQDVAPGPEGEPPLPAMRPPPWSPDVEDLERLAQEQAASFEDLLGMPVPRSGRSAPPPADGAGEAPLPETAPAERTARPHPRTSAMFVADVTVRPSSPVEARTRALASRIPRPRRWLRPRVARGRKGLARHVALASLLAAATIGATIAVSRFGDVGAPPAPAQLPAAGDVASGENGETELTANHRGSADSLRPEPTEAAALPSDRGLVVVRSRSDANVYFNGVLTGTTNAPLEVGCGWRHLRLAEPTSPAPGRSFPVWRDPGRPVLIECRRFTDLALPEEAPP